MSTATDDIVFDCPRCRGPIMVEICHVGAAFECPHCFESIEVPDLAAINKEKFVEPPGLRRILQEVRDREWELMRRKLRAAKAHSAQLEARLAEAKTVETKAAATTTRENASASKETEALRKQVADLGDKFVLANQAFSAGRKLHESTLEHLRRDLEAAREETQTFRKEHEGALRALHAAHREIEAGRQQSASLADENGGLKAGLEWARCEAEELRQKLSIAEIESAELLRMASEETAGRMRPLEEENDALKAELEKALKNLSSAIEAREHSLPELEEVKQHLAERDQEDQSLESALGELESGIKDVVWALAARRERKA